MTTPAPMEVLRRGTVTIHGRVVGSSNITLLATSALDGADLLAIYKPVSGERELWDFPPGLHRRELAAYLLSELLGLGFVPETVLRADAPFGEGSLQRVVEEDGESHYFTLREDERWHPELRRIAAFDVIVNNADRKSGHVLLADDRLWAIDHGLTFHCEPKLRTVIWDFVGDPLDDALSSSLERLVTDRLPDALARLVDRDEQRALVGRARALLRIGRLPGPDTGRPYPWPLV